MNALLRTDSGAFETTVRRRMISLTGFVVRMGEEYLPSRVMVVEMFGGWGYSGGEKRDRMKDLEEDVKATGIKFNMDHEAARKVGRWHRWVGEGPDVFMWE